MSSADRWLPAGCTWPCAAALGFDAPDGTFLRESRSGELIWQPAEPCCFPSLGHLENCFTSHSSWPPSPLCSSQAGLFAVQQAQSLGLLPGHSAYWVRWTLTRAFSCIVRKGRAPTWTRKRALRTPTPTHFFPDLNFQVVSVCTIYFILFLSLLLQHAPQPTAIPALQNRAIVPLLVGT